MNLQEKADARRSMLKARRHKRAERSHIKGTLSHDERLLRRSARLGRRLKTLLNSSHQKVPTGGRKSRRA